MGRIKTQLIKRNTLQIYEQFKDRFSSDYTENKTQLDQLASIRSKKLRNIIAGYLTRLVRMHGQG